MNGLFVAGFFQNPGWSVEVHTDKLDPTNKKGLAHYALLKSSPGFSSIELRSLSSLGIVSLPWASFGPE